MLKNQIDFNGIKDKGKNNLKINSCIDTVQYLLVDLCKKISNLQFNECAGIFKNKLLADVVSYLRLEFQEELFYFNNFLKIINKLPDIFQKYFNMEMDQMIENINNLSKQNLFRLKNDNNKNNSSTTSTSNSNNNSNNTKSSVFLEFILNQIFCVRDLLDLIKSNVENYSKLFEIANDTHDLVNNSLVSFDEEVFREAIEDLEKLLLNSNGYLNDYADNEYLQNTFYPILYQIYDDTNTIKSLLKSYKATLSLDPINSISNMLVARKNIEQFKLKHQNNLTDLKVYLYLIQFYIDNNHKINILFKTYFENKKNSLLESFNSLKNNNAISSDLHIKNEVFHFKNNFYVEKYMKKCFEENLDIHYFVIIFEKRKNLDNEYYDYKENLMKNYYLNSNLLFIESDDELGILSIFHTIDNNYKSILNEIGNCYKNIYINSNLGDSKNNFSSTLTQIPNGVSYIKNKINNNKEFLLIHKISNYMFIAVKIKEKNSSDVVLVNELCKDFKIKFAELHLFKTIFNIKY